MLRRIELNQRRWHWSHTKKAESGADEPQPILLEGEQELHEEQQERERREAYDVAAAFGIDVRGMSIAGR